MMMIRVIVRAIKEELRLRRFYANLRKRPPAGNVWADAVSKITTKEWKEKLQRLGHGRF